jgi:dihydroorotate dehydrogenase
MPNADETGGLSGAPLFALSTAVQATAVALAGELPIIGVGGIMSGADAAERIAAGASLVQFYTGFIYRGPKLVGEAGGDCPATAGMKSDDGIAHVVECALATGIITRLSIAQPSLPASRDPLPVPARRRRSRQ